MASDINRVVLVGRMVRDPELKYTQGGTSVTSFSIANNRSYMSSKSSEKKEMVSFFNCVAWTKMGEVIAQYCKKGQRIAIEGRLQQRSWDDQSGNKRSTVEIVVENFQFLSGKDEGGRQMDRQDTQDQGPSQPEAVEGSFADDDIPF